MKVYNIMYKETICGVFGVEAESEEEAYSRFDEWRINDDHVYDTMNCCDIDSSSYIISNANLYQDDILTNEKYHQLSIDWYL